MQVIQDRNAWAQVIDQCGQADFYHTYDYHQISKKTDETAILLHYEKEDSLIALPLLIRNIEGTTLKDATSVYGYVGPIGENIGPEFDNGDFRKELCEFLKDNQIISVFSRLHPFFTNQDTILRGMGNIVPHGNVVNIDLTQSLEQQKQQYGRRLKTYINKETKEYEIIDGASEKFLDEFIGTYCENMKRLKAKPSYFFGKNYFYKLLASGQIHAELLVAQHKKSGDFAGGGIFTKNKGMVQYHLSGVKSEYFHLNPVKLLIDHVRKKSTEEGCANFNLGGGLNGQDNDSLFYFKSGFSKDFKKFCTWQYIVDDAMYTKLLKQCGATKTVNVNKNSCFFPLYRQDFTNKTEVSKINCLGDD